MLLFPCIVLCSETKKLGTVSSMRVADRLKPMFADWFILMKMVDRSRFLVVTGLIACKFLPRLYCLPIAE